MEQRTQKSPAPPVASRYCCRETMRDKTPYFQNPRRVLLCSSFIKAEPGSEKPNATARSSPRAGGGDAAARGLEAPRGVAAAPKASRGGFATSPR